MKKQIPVSRRVASIVLASVFALANVNGANAADADLSRLVVLGDSLSAGVQNFSLLDVQQPHGYAFLIATQAGTPMTLPLVPYPGAPNVLTLVDPTQPPVIVAVPGTLPSPPRDNPTVQATNLSIPGITIADALLTPSQIPAYQGPVASWAEIVLGFPGPAQSQVQEALALKPTTAILWLGNNDALVPAITGQLEALTPLPVFTAAYHAVISTLATTKATLITANVPDLTAIPYFTSVAGLAEEARVPVTTVTSILGIGSQDFIRSTGVPIALGLLKGQAPPATLCLANQLSSSSTRIAPTWSTAPLRSYRQRCRDRALNNRFLQRRDQPAIHAIWIDTCGYQRASRTALRQWIQGQRALSEHPLPRRAFLP